jgi:hypothetical protein
MNRIVEYLAKVQPAETHPFYFCQFAFYAFIFVKNIKDIFLK